jgi:hypothetical protein
MKKDKKNKPQELNDETYTFIREVKKVVLTSIYNDDKLAEYLTLKGGTLLDMIWGITKRPSIDIDLSIDTTSSELDNVDVFEKSLFQALDSGFQKGINGESYSIIDFKLEQRPDNISDDLKHFWGGYMASFSIIKTSENTTSLRGKMRTSFIGKSKIKNGTTFLSKKFSIDISLHEICLDDRNENKEFEDTYIAIYTPLMVVYEKLRAICQTADSYNVIIKRSRDSKPRTKDFYDIFMIMNSDVLNVDILENLPLLKRIFEVKRVPIDFLKDIKNNEEFHGANFEQLLSTLPKDEVEHPNFKPYFDYVVDLIENGILPNL